MKAWGRFAQLWFQQKKQTKKKNKTKTKKYQVSNLLCKKQVYVNWFMQYELCNCNKTEWQNVEYYKIGLGSNNKKLASFEQLPKM